MLGRKKRLSRKEFDRFFSVGRRIHSHVAQLVYHKYPTLHVSVVVPKKVQNTATKRNVLRRRVYNIMQDMGAAGIFIFILKNAANECSYGRLKKEIQTLIQKAMEDNRHQQ